MVVHVSADRGQWSDPVGNARSAELAEGARRRAHEGGHCGDVGLDVAGCCFEVVQRALEAPKKCFASAEAAAC